MIEQELGPAAGGGDQPGPPTPATHAVADPPPVIDAVMAGFIGWLGPAR
jgi:hypothetical protein